MITNRISYAIRTLAQQDKALTQTVLKGRVFDTKDICEFLKIVHSSVFEWSKRISEFIECICFGNMRLALNMFATFLTSGATDVDKMLLIYRKAGHIMSDFMSF